MAVKELENYYKFDCKLADGTTEVLKIPRVSTRIKYRLGIAIQRLGENASEEELAEILIDYLCPGLMDRIGEKSPTIIALSLLTQKIIDMDGDTIFGKGWRKNSKEISKKGAKKHRKRAKKSTK